MAINLRVMANSVTSVINPNIPAVLKRSIGYVTDDAGVRVNTFMEQNIVIQSQSMTSKELQLVESLGLQGYSRAVHINGNIEGLRRHVEQGADILTFKQHDDAEPMDWMVVQVMESWANWCRVLLCRQGKAPAVILPPDGGGGGGGIA